MADNFFAFSQEIGFERYQSAEQAKARADLELSEYRDLAVSDGWDTCDTEKVCWGVILESAQVVIERPITDEDHWSSDFDTFVEYGLVATNDLAQSKAITDVLAERRRQIEAEGWTTAHDDEHVNGELAQAAGCYAIFGQTYEPEIPPQYWPFGWVWWKPSDHRSNLIKAAALLLAEIERLDRKGGAS